MTPSPSSGTCCRPNVAGATGRAGRRSRVLVPLFALLILLGGCTGNNPLYDARVYCDDSGCYRCAAGTTNCEALAKWSCTSDQDCGGKGIICTNVGCTNTCGGDNDCADGWTCVGGYCSPDAALRPTPYLPSATCTEDAQCRADQYCNREQARCSDKCKSDDQCAPGTVCAECGKCQPKDLPATCGQAKVYCSETVACGEGKSCVQGRCHFQCEGTGPCPVGQLCSEGLCKDDPAPAAPECALNLQCENGTCVNGYCHAVCESSAECGFGALCLIGICQPDYQPSASSH
jgi:hypothetical protein